MNLKLTLLTLTTCFATVPAHADTTTLPTGGQERVELNAPAERQLSAKVLAGIEGIYFDVGPFSQAFARFERSPGDIEAEVTARLQAAGIPLVSEDEYQSAPNAAALTLALRANPDGTQIYFYSWTLTVSDKETLRSPDSYLARPLWSNGDTGVLVPGEFHQMDQQLDALIDSFITAYNQRND